MKYRESYVGAAALVALLAAGSAFSGTVARGSAEMRPREKACFMTLNTLVRRPC